MSILRNLQPAARSLWRDRSFSVSAIATLGVGIGATLAVFSVIEAVLLRPLPYPEPQRVVMLNHHDEQTGIVKDFVALGDVIDIAERNTSFDAIGSYGQGNFVVQERGEQFEARAFLATSGTIDILGVRAAVGRPILPDDSKPGAPTVVMLGHEFWQRVFGGDSSVINRSIRVGQQDVQVVGVAQPGWGYPPAATTDLIASLVMPASVPPEQRRNWTLAMARLKPGVALATAAAEVSTIDRALEAEYPATNVATRYRVVPFRDALVGNTGRALMLLFAAVAIVLLIAFANVANLVLVRSLGRQRDTAVRMALGAGTPRIAGQVATEMGLLAVVSAVIGIGMAGWGAESLVRLVPESASVPALATVQVNGLVLAVAFALVAVATVAFAAIATVKQRPEAMTSVLATGVRSSFGRSARRMLSGIVCAELAFAVLLLFGGGLVLKSFARLVSVDPGFDPANVAVVNVTLPSGRYPAGEARRALYDRLFAAIAARPGVEHVGTAQITPLTGNNWTHPFVRAESPPGPNERPPEVGWQVASEGYFKALRIPLKSGRLFDATDRPDSRPVVIISDVLERRYFPEGSAVGRQVLLGGTTPAEVVGVVGGIRRAALTDEPRLDMYLPFERSPSNGVTLFIRTGPEVATTLSAIREAIREVDRDILVRAPSSLESVVSASVAVPRLLLALLSVFGGLAVVLAMVGIYGVTSYAVAQQSREIGTRIALGASRGAIYGLVLRQGLLLGVVGTAIGTVVALLASGVLRAVLYGTTPADPLVLVAVPVLMLAVVAAACLVPARRATRVPPTEAMTSS